MKKTLSIILLLLITLFVSGCSIDIKTNKELRQAKETSDTISGLQQKIEWLNKEIGLSRQVLSGLQLQKQISDLQAENAKLKKTTTKKATTTTTSTTTNTRAIQKAMERAINEQAKCRSYKAAHPEAYLMSCDVY